MRTESAEYFPPYIYVFRGTKSYSLDGAPSSMATCSRGLHSSKLVSQMAPWNSQLRPTFFETRLATGGLVGYRSVGVARIRMPGLATLITHPADHLRAQLLVASSPSPTATLVLPGKTAFPRLLQTRE